MPASNSPYLARWKSVCNPSPRLQLTQLAASRQAALDSCTQAALQLQEQERRGATLDAELLRSQADLQGMRAERDAARVHADKLAATAAGHARAVQQLESQCSVLREQLSFMESQQASDAERDAELRCTAAAAHAEGQQLQQQVRGMDVEMAHMHAAQAQLRSQLAEAEEDLAGAQQEAAAALRVAVAADAAAQHSHCARDEAEGRAAELQRQLEVVEALKDDMQQVRVPCLDDAPWESSVVREWLLLCKSSTKKQSSSRPGDLAVPSMAYT